MASQAYVFAHQAIPSEAFADPARFYSIINGPDADQYMADIWKHVAQYGEPAEQHTGLQPRAEIRGTGNGIIALIFMPPPLETTEAHIVGFFAKFTNPDNPSLEELDWSRLFALEHSIDVDTNAPITMLCEWTPDGDHLNFGNGPEPQERPFVEAVFAQLRREVEGDN